MYPQGDRYEGFEAVAGFDPKQHWVVEYLHQGARRPRELGFHIARLQSTSTHRRVSGETVELRERRGAKVLSADGTRIVIAYPDLNIGDNPAGLLLATHLERNPSLFDSLIIEDITPPTRAMQSTFSKGDRVFSAFRDSACARRAPVLFVVLKPSLGLSLEAYVERARQAFTAGADIVKDDENLLPQDPELPLEHRAEGIGRMMARLPLTGYPRSFLFNIQGPDYDLHCQLLEAISQRYCVAFSMMMSPLMGLASLYRLRKLTEMPLVAHSAGLGMFTRGPVRYSYRAYAKLMRLSGVDVVIIPPPDSDHYDVTREEVISFSQGCMAEMGNIPEVLPAFGGAMQASRHADLSHLIGPQYGFVAGGAVFGHPDGIEAGIINIIKQFSISQP